MIEINIPGVGPCRFEHLVLDVNGTIARDGQLLSGVKERLDRLRERIEVHLITADTHGAQASIDQELRLTATRLPPTGQAQAKLAYIQQLVPQTVVAIGNGANDALMLEHAALGILVIGHEGAAVETLLRAKVVVTDIGEALELLLYPHRLIATLRR
ncbi:MAG: ATPase P [Acidobacteria bacterium]|nr:ATPase P [Acidobacteriota bacterium]